MQITGEDIAILAHSYQAMQDYLDIIVGQAAQANTRWTACGGAPLWSAQNASTLTALREAITTHQTELRETAFTI